MRGGPRRRLRPVLVLLSLAVTALGATAGLTARMFVWPPSDDPDRVDAVVVLSGDRGERMANGLRLMSRGVAPVLVHAGTPDSQEVLRLCAGRQPFEVVCLRPNPDNTRAEARAVAALGEVRGWRSIAVVTSTPHLTRATILFRRCFDGDVQAVDARPSFSPREWRGQVVKEWAGVLHALTVGRRC